MKKFCLICVYLFVSFPIFSQTLAYRNDKDSYLQVGTNYVFEGKSAFLVQFDPRTGVALEYGLHKDSGEETFCLDFRLMTYELEFSFDKNANLYIKTFNDNLIVLHQLHNCGDVKKDKKRVSDKSSSYYYYVDPDYMISKGDLQIIMSEGIKKMSFMTTKGYHTLEFEHNTLGEIISKEYDLILGKSDFSADF